MNDDLAQKQGKFTTKSVDAVQVQKGDTIVLVKERRVHLYQVLETEVVHHNFCGRQTHTHVMLWVADMDDYLPIVLNPHQTVQTLYYDPTA